MSQKNKIELEYSAILQVPLDKFENDFTFIVNGEEFQTNKIISTLLSPKISQNYFIDPTMNTFTINTKEHGDFSKFFNLLISNQIIFHQTNFHLSLKFLII